MWDKENQARDKSGKALRAGVIQRPEICSKCGKNCKPDGHHENYDKPLDLKFLCRSCHMEEDGRMPKFLSTCRGFNPVFKDPTPCIVCNRFSKPLRRGRCHACNEYLRRHGVERPYVQDGRIEKAAGTEMTLCLRCARSADIVGSPVRGYCKSCYTYLQRQRNSRSAMARKAVGDLFEVAR